MHDLFVASAPGKVILCGEHAVVYGQMAIALPVSAVAAYATVRAGDRRGLVVEAADLGEVWRVDERPEHPLATVWSALRVRLPVGPPPALHVSLRSTIPIAGGMGSGAAISAAFVRALAGYLGLALDPADVSGMVYEAERQYHGTPSGIDNTVVSFGRPIVYRRHGEGAVPLMEPLALPGVLRLVIGDTGVRAPTRVTVAAVRERWQTSRQHFDALFTWIGEAVEGVRAALRADDLRRAGRLLDENQRLLQEVGVSSPELERLITAARRAGALGAKLSGGGGGGIMLALVEPTGAGMVERALRSAGAVRVIVTDVTAGPGESIVV